MKTDPANIPQHVVGAATSPDRCEFVRVSPELVEQFEAEGGLPVHIVDVQRHDDGSLELIVQTADAIALLAAVYDQARANRGYVSSGLLNQIAAVLDRAPDSKQANHAD